MMNDCKRPVKIIPVLDKTGRSGIAADPGLRFAMLHNGHGLSVQFDPDLALEIGNWLRAEALDNGADDDNAQGLVDEYRLAKMRRDQLVNSSLESVRRKFVRTLKS